MNPSAKTRLMRLLATRHIFICHDAVIDKHGILGYAKRPKTLGELENNIRSTIAQTYADMLDKNLTMLVLSGSSSSTSDVAGPKTEQKMDE